MILGGGWRLCNLSKFLLQSKATSTNKLTLLNLLNLLDTDKKENKHRKRDIQFEIGMLNTFKSFLPFYCNIWDMEKHDPMKDILLKLSFSVVTNEN